MALTEKQKAFCREYFSNGGNGTQAYLTAYDSQSEVAAANESSLLLKKDEIQQYLATLNQPLEKQAQSERERKRQILWDFITDSNTPNADRLRAMDILNRMDAEYININRNIDDGKPDISHIDLDKLKQLAGV